MNIAQWRCLPIGRAPGRRDCLTAVNGLREWTRSTPRPETVSVRGSWHCAPNPCGEHTPGPAQTFDVPGLVGFLVESNLSYQQNVFGASVSVCTSIHSCPHLISHVLDSTHLLLLLADPLYYQEMPLYSDFIVRRHHLTRDGGPSFGNHSPRFRKTLVGPSQGFCLSSFQRCNDIRWAICLANVGRSYDE